MSDFDPVLYSESGGGGAPASRGEEGWSKKK